MSGGRGPNYKKERKSKTTKVVRRKGENID